MGHRTAGPQHLSEGLNLSNLSAHFSEKNTQEWLATCEKLKQGQNRFLLPRGFQGNYAMQHAAEWQAHKFIAFSLVQIRRGPGWSI